MKFLENTKLEKLSAALSRDTGDCRLDVRVESYSCKMVQNDKRQFTKMLSACPGDPNQLQPLSPPVTDENPWLGHSPNTARNNRSTSGSDQDETGNVLCDSISRKLLFHLTTLLNTSFTDYDFSDAKGENFSRFHGLDVVMRAVDTQLSSVIESYSRVKDDVWSILDEEIQLKECNIYSYKPDYVSDPFSEDGCLWSFNYFFYNKRLKRILFFACRAQSALVNSADVEQIGETQWNLE